MAVHGIHHPRWGTNLTIQLTVEDAVNCGENGDGYHTVTVHKWFGGEKLKKKHLGCIRRPATDNDSVKRKFQHRCGLLKIVMVPTRERPLFTVFLDGHATSNFVSEQMEFRFLPADLKDNAGKPTAEVWFFGQGTRHGPLSEYYPSRIVCTFADIEQMDQYLYLSNHRLPKSIVHRGVTYSATPADTYQSSDGSILPNLLVVYFLLSSNEQLAFAGANPELLSMLTDNIAGTPDNNNQLPADGADYGDEGSHSDGGDSGGSGDGGDSGGGGD